jgi:DNA-binding transcriptional MocR family regulator
MLAALDIHMNPEWGVTWTRPSGGMFLWLTLPSGLDARSLFEVAIDEHVAFVTGTAFHCDGSGANTLRLNFSYPTVEQIHAGIARLAKAVDRVMVSRASKG